MMPPPFAGITWILVFNDFCYYFACWSQRCLLIYIYTYLCVCACMYVCMFVCLYVCIYVCMYVRMYLCMYAYNSLQRFLVLDFEVKEKVADPGDKRTKPAPC
jgi:hypothetical protein